MTKIDELDPRLWEHINPERMYRRAEVERLLNCSSSQVLVLIYKGELTSTKVGSHYRIPGWTIIEYIQRKAIEALEKD